jgi:hypothetical protein
MNYSSDKKTVTLNGSDMTRQKYGDEWIITKVKPASGGIDKVKEYSDSKEFAETLKAVGDTLQSKGYPVDDKFKEVLRTHLLDEFARGRKLENAELMIEAIAIEKNQNDRSR